MTIQKIDQKLTQLKTNNKPVSSKVTPSIIVDCFTPDPGDKNEGQKVLKEYRELKDLLQTKKDISKNFETYSELKVIVQNEHTTEGVKVEFEGFIEKGSVEPQEISGYSVEGTSIIAIQYENHIIDTNFIRQPTGSKDEFVKVNYYEKDGCLTKEVTNRATFCPNKKHSEEKQHNYRVVVDESTGEIIKYKPFTTCCPDHSLF